MLMALLLMAIVTSAQCYAIRVTFNTNLRASASLQASIVETAPAGTTLNVIGEFNRWLKINSNGNEVWMADWVGYERVEDEPPVSTQSQTTTNIDNCCFIDRLCMTDQEWTDGYWAFQNNQCGAPVQTQTQTQTSTQPASVDPSQADNCCFLGWQCTTDEQWRSGFQAYQNNQCAGAEPTTSTTPITGPIPEGVDNCCFLNRQCHTDQDYVIGYEQFTYGLCHVPNIAGNTKIEGSNAYVSRVKDAFNVLLTRAPKWYDYATKGLWKIIEVPENRITVWADGRRAIIGTPFVFPDSSPEWALTRLAAMLVHEACHVHRDRAGLQSGELVGETACLELEIETLRGIFPPSNSRVNYLLDVHANIHRTSVQWWHD